MKKLYFDELTQKRLEYGLDSVCFHPLSQYGQLHPGYFNEKTKEYTVNGIKLMAYTTALMEMSTYSKAYYEVLHPEMFLKK